MATSMATSSPGEMSSMTEEAEDQKVKLPGKSHKSAVIIMPPEDVWDQIQEIRKEHDKAYKRWMPHINMLYPFKADIDDGEVFAESAKTIKEGLADIQPFKVIFSKESLNYFAHKKSCTMWLKPLPGDKGEGEDGDVEGATADTDLMPHPAVMKIQNKLETIFPEYTDLSTIGEKGFQPHLSLGQFKPKVMKSVIEEYKDNWNEIEFEVKEIYLISREDFDDPFHIRQRVPLGSSKGN